MACDEAGAGSDDTVQQYAQSSVSGNGCEDDDFKAEEW